MRKDQFSAAIFVNIGFLGKVGFSESLIQALGNIPIITLD
jgi:hypothetical protein